MTFTRLESALIDFVYMFEGPMRLSARAAAKRVEKAGAPFEKPGFFGHPDNDGKNMVIYVTSTDKAFWLRLAAQEDTIVGFLANFSAAHSFKKKELIPLLQHLNPDMKMLGLKLMSSTLPDAKTSPVRVSGR